MAHNLLTESIHNYFLERKNDEQRLENIQIIENIESYINNSNKNYILNIEEIIRKNADSFDYMYHLFYALEARKIPVGYIIDLLHEIEKSAHNFEFMNHLKIARKRFSTFPRGNPNIEIDHSYINDGEIKVINYLNEEFSVILLSNIDYA